MYQSIEHLRGVWGLEDRAYSESEIKASPHLQAAVAAGALVKQESEQPRKQSVRAKGVTDGSDD